jgi:dsRNA-specific ribonuclease
MARQITEVLMDDIDGGNASVSVQFAYEGTSYAIDLNKRNAKKFDEALKPWIAAGRRVAPRSRTARKSTKAADPAFLAKVRAWAKENGQAVSARGRIAQQTLDAYKAAN